ncbi:NHL repeat-containing protein [Hydrogenophaga sp. 2FB]|uniref:NHL repeat-containing protein n=1 Tax=Hydrogenophaga sp. 2FB TaxID=2502187 RepID=UPI0010F50D07|nr:NHL repeat-containing protein [Hydrogenophaga sp. 2FB]
MAFTTGTRSERCIAALCAALLLASCGGNSTNTSTNTAHTVGGTVTGLSGTVELQTSAGDRLTLKADGAFAFPAAIATNSPYQVSVRTQPLWQNCSVGQGSGTATADVSNVSVTCAVAAAEVSTFAGTGVAGWDSGSASTATFSFPFGIVVRPDGGLLVSDYGSERVRSVSSTGDVTTLAGGGPAGASVNGVGPAASFFGLRGLALDAAGNAYAADFSGHFIRQITPTAVVSFFAGTGASGSHNADRATSTFDGPMGVATGATGDLYVVDQTQATVRQITPGGAVSTLAGSGLHAFADDTGTSASFSAPSGIAVDPAGNVYVGDTYNHRIRKITPTGVVTTLAGSGANNTADGIGTQAAFAEPFGLTVDKDGNVYVVERHGHVLRRITPQGVVSTLAGAPGMAGATDGLGSNARFDSPMGVAIAADGTLFITDTFNHKIRKVTPVR